MSHISCQSTAKNHGSLSSAYLPSRVPPAHVSHLVSLLKLKHKGPSCNGGNVSGRVSGARMIQPASGVTARAPCWGKRSGRCEANRGRGGKVGHGSVEANTRFPRLPLYCRCADSAGNTTGPSGPPLCGAGRRPQVTGRKRKKNLCATRPP